MADHQQVTTLQYCLVNNCTTMRVDNGEILDITYTTDSLLVATPRRMQTSQVIARDDTALSCVPVEIQQSHIAIIVFG